MMDDDADADEDYEDYDYDERCLKLISVLKRKKLYPKRTRKKIKQLVDIFLNEIEFDVHGMFCNNNADGDVDDYRGLDSSRDTEDEVEAIVRAFPEVLSRRKEFIWDEEDERWVENRNDMDRNYPIHYLTLLGGNNNSTTSFRMYNLKAISFVPLVVKLSIEFGWLDEDVRGGLLIRNGRGDNILQLLAHNGETENQEHHKLIDNKYLLVMKQLRQMNYLKKEDIQEYDLLNKVCTNCYHNLLFAEKRFKFLAEWDPTLLIPIQPDNGRRDLLPLHCVAASGSIQGFQIVFEYGLLYYPNKKGISILFMKDDLNCTPFQILCEQYGSEKVMEVIEDTLIRYTSSSLNLDNNTTAPRLNIVDALLSAAIDENVHFDCVYFLMRRHPDMVLMKLLPQLSSGIMSSTTVVVSASKNDDDDANGTSNSNGNSNSTSKNDDEISSRSNINNYRDDMNDGRSNSSSDNDDSRSSNLNDNYLMTTTITSPKKRKRKQKDDNK
jgi:hypothetical protein